MDHPRAQREREKERENKNLLIKYPSSLKITHSHSTQVKQCLNQADSMYLSTLASVSYKMHPQILLKPKLNKKKLFLQAHYQFSINIQIK